MAGGQRIAVQVDGDAAEWRVEELELVAEARGDRPQYPRGFGRDLGADAVAGDDRDACLHARAPLEACDRGLLRAQIAELVDAIEQAVAREALDLEGHLAAVGQHDTARLRGR